MSTTEGISATQPQQAPAQPAKPDRSSTDHLALDVSKANKAMRDVSARTQEVREVATRNALNAEAHQEKTGKLLSGMAAELDEAIQVLNESLAKTPTKAMISKDEYLNRFVVKIADKSSGEIVREIPSEALLKFARHLKELKGLLFDEKG